MDYLINFFVDIDIGGLDSASSGPCFGVLKSTIPSQNPCIGVCYGLCLGVVGREPKPMASAAVQCNNLLLRMSATKEQIMEY